MHFSGFLLLGFATIALAKPTWWVLEYKDKASCDKSHGNRIDYKDGQESGCQTFAKAGGGLSVGLPNLPGYKLVAYSGDNCKGNQVLTTTSIDQNCKEAKGVKSIKVTVP